jgi:outer membrane protein assembly factor BamB
MPSRRALLGGFGAAAGTALAGCLGGPTARYAGESGDEPDTAWWPLPEFDRIAGCYNPRPVGPREGVTERWRVDISGPSARPVVADGTAYLPTADALVAVDAATGEQQWREDGDDPPLWPRRVAVHDGLVYLAQVGDPGVLALDAATGDRQWSVPTTTSGVRTLLVDSERDDLYLGGGRGTVLGLDARTGERYWSREVFGPVTALAESIPELLVATEAGEVYGLSGDDGRGYWRAQVPGPVESLATANGRGAFVSTFGGPTVELEGTRAGAVGWRRGVWSADSFVVAGRSLVGAGRRLVSLDYRSDGRRQWTGGRTTRCGPAAAGDTVYAAAADRVTAYAFGGGTGLGPLRVGTRRWSHPVEGRPEQGLAVADGAVFVLTEGTREGEQSSAYALEAP